MLHNLKQYHLDFSDIDYIRSLSAIKYNRLYVIYFGGGSKTC